MAGHGRGWGNISLELPLQALGLVLIVAPGAGAEGLANR
jgi:hypothetical protein